VSAPTVSVEPPVRVDRPTMIQRWSALSFIHWPCEVREVRGLVPEELAVDTFDGAAWVGLIPFRLRIRLPGLPYVPWLAGFPETNLRTYVIGPDGRPGIWFMSLDAARLGAVVAARTSYRLPYMWALAAMRSDEDRVRYRGRRRWPAPDAAYDIALDLGPAVEEPTELERFLTARWHLFAPDRLRLPPRGLALVRTTVEHPPWPLRAARVRHLEESLRAAAGVPSSTARPIALYAPGVETRFARRVRVTA
jgi:uncharacterized protein